jgi:hypothetical protein
MMIAIPLSASISQKRPPGAPVACSTPAVPRDMQYYLS